MKINLWLLTEERPKKEVLTMILSKFVQDYGFTAFCDNLRILPILDGEKFTFTYELTGFHCNKVNKIFIKTVSGYSSFVDFLVFYQNQEPNFEDTPIYAIEETKTDDKESRNTGVYQRCSKFVFIEHFYPKIRKTMLYNQLEQKEKPTDTYIFGTRLLLTLGVEILGKKLDDKVFIPFSSVQELIELKKNMRKAPKGNIPIAITKDENVIKISGRLFKSNSLSHDPNIGALSIICAVLRKLEWSGIIEITHHGLMQNHINEGNKFIKIANSLGVSLEGLKMPHIEEKEKKYWKYDLSGEKTGTIFIHLVVESFTAGYSIFENHAGSERGYFITKEGKSIPLAKYKDRAKYKAGDKEEIIHIPDLILIDFERNEIINVEGKKYAFRKKAIEELKNYDFIEQHYILKYYPNFKIIRTVILYGSNASEVVEIEVGFLLNENGSLILGIKAPALFQEAIKNLLDFWN